MNPQVARLSPLSPQNHQVDPLPTIAVLASLLSRYHPHTCPSHFRPLHAVSPISPLLTLHPLRSSFCLYLDVTQCCRLVGDSTQLQGFKGCLKSIIMLWFAHLWCSLLIFVLHWSTLLHQQSLCYSRPKIWVGCNISNLKTYTWRHFLFEIKVMTI